MDIGTRALDVAVNAFLAVERVGMPEGAKVLARAALYVACAEKTDTASRGLREALECVRLQTVLGFTISAYDLDRAAFNV